MNYPMIAASIASVSLLGALFGIALAYAAKIFYVHKDEQIAAIESTLAGLNCGICGFVGCSAYATAIAAGEAELNLCTPGGNTTLSKLSAILNIQIDTQTKRKIVQIHCRGGEKTATYDYKYTGIPDCNAAFLLQHGNKTCKFGCLGFGSCIPVCPTQAIYYDKENLIWIDGKKCIGCLKCITICPTKVLRVVPYNADKIVACNSHDKGAITKKNCSVGCIACKICEKKSPDGGYSIVDFLAIIDYETKGERQEAQKACPSSCIIPAQKE